MTTAIGKVRQYSISSTPSETASDRISDDIINKINNISKIVVDQTETIKQLKEENKVKSLKIADLTKMNEIRDKKIADEISEKEKLSEQANKTEAIVSSNRRDIQRLKKVICIIGLVLIVIIICL